MIAGYGPLLCPFYTEYCYFLGVPFSLFRFPFSGFAIKVPLDGDSCLVTSRVVSKDNIPHSFPEHVLPDQRLPCVKEVEIRILSGKLQR